MLRWLTKRGGLRAKMVASVLVPTAVILAAVGIVAFVAFQQVTESLVMERNRSRTHLLANQLSADLEDYQLPLSAVGLTGAGEPQCELQALLEREWPGGNLAPFDAGVIVLDADGVVMAAVPDWPHAASELPACGDTLPELAADAVASDDQSLPFTNVLVDGVREMDVIAFSQPVKDDEGKTRATVVGLFHAERGATRTSVFYRNIWNLYIGRRETAYLVDGEGRVIFHPDTFLIGKDFSDLTVVQRALSQQGGAVRTHDIEGRDVVAGFAPVPRTPWALVTEDRWSEITRTSRPYRRFVAGLLVLGAVVPVVIVALGVRRITRPLAQLTRAAEEVASGDFGQTIDVRTGDELETLAEQFNAMAAELRASYTNLEQRVEDRTRELSTLNAVAAVVSRSLELEEVMGAALRKTLETVEMEAGAAFRLEGDMKLSLIADEGLSEGFVRQVRTIPLHQSIAARAIAGRSPVVASVEDYPEGALKSLLLEEGLRSVVSVPLVAKNEALGVLNLATCSPRTLTEEQRSLLASVGRQTGLAVENARLYEQAEAAAAAAERNRLARELHDAVSQTLFSASMIADVLPRLWERDPEEARRRLEDLRRLTRGAMAEMRTLLWELRPSALLETDLGELLSQLGKAVAGRADVQVVVEVKPVASLPPEMRVALYRIAQEALNNVVKHAGASQVVVTAYARDGDGELCIRDNGQGFTPEDVPPGHLGLSTMKERAASIGAVLTVDSDPGQGTEVNVAWKEKAADEPK